MHHIYPQQHFLANAKSPLLIICRSCHNELEKVISFEEKIQRIIEEICGFYSRRKVSYLEKERYREIISEFLNHEDWFVFFQKSSKIIEKIHQKNLFQPRLHYKINDVYDIRFVEPAEISETVVQIV